MASVTLENMKQALIRDTTQEMENAGSIQHLPAPTTHCDTAHFSMYSPDACLQLAVVFGKYQLFCGLKQEFDKLLSPNRMLGVAERAHVEFALLSKAFLELVSPETRLGGPYGDPCVHAKQVLRARLRLFAVQVAADRASSSGTLSVDGQLQDCFDHLSSSLHKFDERMCRSAKMLYPAVREETDDLNVWKHATEDKRLLCFSRLFDDDVWSSGKSVLVAP